MVKTNFTDYNHVCDEAIVIKWRIQQEMEKRILRNVSSKVSIVRKQVIVEHSENFKEKPGIWQKVQALLSEDTSLDHRLYDFRERAWGIIPRLMLLLSLNWPSWPIQSISRNVCWSARQKRIRNYEE